MGPAEAVQHVLNGMLLFGTVASVLPPTRYLRFWVIRSWDFPRLQLFVMGVISLLLFAWDHPSWLLPRTPHWPPASLVLRWAEALLVCIALIVQGRFIFPYTPLASKMCPDARPVLQSRHFADSDGSGADALSRTDSTAPASACDRDISILVANVLYENDSYEVLLDDMRAADPDVIVLDEVDDRWLRRLAPVTAQYTHRVEVPQRNCYGLAMYSKLPVREAQVRNLVEPGVPSIFCVLTLRCGTDVVLVCVHPEPPGPTGDSYSTERDSELLLVGRYVRELTVPVIVAGDLNDVAWSRSSSLFLRTSRLCDPRVGRGFYNTFHASVPFMRWSLDHIFHSAHFAVVQLRRLRYFGSDHFPLLLQLRLLHDSIEWPDCGVERGARRASEANRGKQDRRRAACRSALMVQDKRSQVPDLVRETNRPDGRRPALPDAPHPSPPRSSLSGAARGAAEQSGRSSRRAAAPRIGTCSQTRPMSDADEAEAARIVQEAAERAPRRGPSPDDRPRER